MIGIDFGPAAGFELETVSIDTRAPTRCERHTPKPVSAIVHFKASTSVQGCYRANDHEVVAVNLEEGHADAKPVQIAGRFSVIAVEFVEKNTNGSNLTRLSSFDAEGHFTNN
jgi:hypothetical protein